MKNIPINEAIILLAAYPLLLPTDIERVIEQSFVVRAHVQDDSDGSRRIEPTDEGVYDGFGCGNAYALGG